MPLQLDDSSVESAAYEIVGQQDGLRLLAGNRAEKTRVISARSLSYNVTFTFAITYTDWIEGRTPQLVATKTQQVNTLAAYEHTVDVNTSQDVDAQGNVINELVVTVGTPDGLQTVDVAIRMDSIGLPSAMPRLEAAYATLAKAGGL